MSFSILPFSLPFSSQMTTIDLTLFVASSTVFHLPTGVDRDEVCADDRSVEKSSHIASVDLMKSSMPISAKCPISSKSSLQNGSVEHFPLRHSRPQPLVFIQVRSLQKNDFEVP